MSVLCDASAACLLVIDPQARLVPAIDQGPDVIRRIMQLCTAAQTLGIPAIGTEQNPQGLGPNAPEIKALCVQTVAKFDFSAMSEPDFVAALPDDRRDMVVVGCEAHVCVLQTVVGLLDSGHRVHLVSDAIGSRHRHNWQAAIDRGRTLGADIVTTEMVLFEWMRSSRHPSFKTLSRAMR